MHHHEQTIRVFTHILRVLLHVLERHYKQCKTHAKLKQNTESETKQLYSKQLTVELKIVQWRLIWQITEIKKTGINCETEDNMNTV